MSPLSFEEFCSLMEGVGAPPTLAVGCSGGPDSLALTLLLNQWVQQRRGQLTALVVDHGLRPASHCEAHGVQKHLDSLGVRSVLLTCPSLSGNLQAHAREWRYHLMQTWCLDHNLFHLAIAHHQDDQAETFLIRLSRGSGVWGLGAMRPVHPIARPEGTFYLLRPLLTVPKERLVPPEGAVEDPSNTQEKFLRVRFRHLAPLLAQHGLDRHRLTHTASSMRRAAEALDVWVHTHLQRYTRMSPLGFFLFELEGLLSAPEEIVLRSLARMLMAVGGRQYPPRLQHLQRLQKALSEHKKARTLHGCCVRPLKREQKSLQEQVLIHREASAVQECLPLTKVTLWDGRFFLEGRGTGELRRLGPSPHTLAWCQEELHERTAARWAVPSLPALWQGERVVWAPGLPKTSWKSEACPIKKVTFFARHLNVPLVPLWKE